MEKIEAVKITNEKAHMSALPGNLGSIMTLITWAIGASKAISAEVDVVKLTALIFQVERTTPGLNPAIKAVIANATELFPDEHTRTYIVQLLILETTLFPG